MFHQLAHVLMARHLISPMWLEEMHTNNDDDDGVARTDFLLLLGKERTGKKVVTAGASRQRR